MQILTLLALLAAAVAYQPPPVLRGSPVGICASVQHCPLRGHFRASRVMQGRGATARPITGLRASTTGWDAAAKEQQIAEDLAFYEAIIAVDDELLRAATLKALVNTNFRSSSQFSSHLATPPFRVHSLMSPLASKINVVPSCAWYLFCSFHE